MPLNNARLLAGQRFDLRLEVSGDLAANTDPGTFTVTVGGKPLAQAFCKQPVKSNTTPGSAELTVMYESSRTGVGASLMPALPVLEGRHLINVHQRPGSTHRATCVR